MKSFLLSSLLFMGSLNAQGPVEPVASPPANNPAAPTNPGLGEVPPANANPTTPQTPQTTNINPAVPPVNANPATPAQVTPQQPPATAQYGAPNQYQPQPYNPYNPYQPQQPGLGFMAQMDPQYLNCEFGQCRNRRITLSPGQGFTLNCKLPFQCDGLDLTLNVGHDPTNWGSGISEINDLNFDVATNGVKIRINSIMGNNIEVNNIKCKVVGACRNMQIIAGFGVEIHNINFYCEFPGSCQGCTLNGQSCQMFSMMNGNNNGYMPYGYGYTNTPIMPQGQPAQPAYSGAPQQQGYPGASPMAQQGVPQYPQYSNNGYPPYNPYPQWI